MNLSLSNMLSSSVSGLDPDAKGYIDAVVAAGATVSGGQKSAINTFFKTGKSDGWYSSLKRLYLPIWASAAPNAIDMIGLTSGTFNGTVTHAAGYVQGDGTTGYFDTVTTPASVGVSVGNSMIGRGIYLRDSTSGVSNDFDACGCYNTGTDRFHLNLGPVANAVQFYQTGSATFAQHSNITEIGFITAGWATAANRKAVSVRTSAGWETPSIQTTPESVAIAAESVAFLARNAGGVPERFSDGREFVWWFGTNPNDAGMELLTAALKTLWETCTGLVLP